MDNPEIIFKEKAAEQLAEFQYVNKHLFFGMCQWDETKLKARVIIANTREQVGLASHRKETEFDCLTRKLASQLFMNGLKRSANHG